MTTVNRPTQDDLESGDDEVHRSTVCVGYMMLVIIVALVLGALWLWQTQVADGLYVTGDVDCDMAVTQADAESILMYDVGLLPGAQTCTPGAVYLRQCDVTMDGLCNVVDAMVVLQRISQGGVR